MLHGDCMSAQPVTQHPRVVAWFSCGAASAIATVLAKIKYGDRLQAVYCRVRDEHPDNMDFLSQFSDAVGIHVTVIENEKYHGSVTEVLTKRAYIKGPHGAPCTTHLKKDMRKAYQSPGDIQVFGYTVEEQDRADRFVDANNDVAEDFILIDNGITKRQCYDLLTKALRLPLPPMYRMGYNNNNCIGCVKGGMGYWNKIRVDFPQVFEERARLERLIGHAINKDQKGPVYLDELAPDRGRFESDVPADCGFTCEVSK